MGILYTMTTKKRSSAFEARIERIAEAKIRLCAISIDGEGLAAHCGEQRECGGLT